MKMHPLLVGSTPKSPLSDGDAEFFKGDRQAIVQPAEMSSEQFKSEARAAIKDFEAQSVRFLIVTKIFKKRWREFGPTQDLACSEVFGCSLAALRQRLYRVKDNLDVHAACDLTPEEDKKNTLTAIANLPTPPGLDDLLDNIAASPNPAPPPSTQPAAAPAPPPAPAPAPVAEHKPEPPKDKFGRLIPQHCLPLVERATEDLQPVLSASSKLTGLFSNLSDDLKHPDPLFAFAQGHIQEGLDHARWLHHLLRDCKPELVCPACDGAGKKCEVCLGTGMVSDYTWHHRITGSLSGDPKLADKAKSIEKGKK